MAALCILHFPLLGQVVDLSLLESVARQVQKFRLGRDQALKTPPSTALQPKVEALPSHTQAQLQGPLGCALALGWKLREHPRPAAEVHPTLQATDAPDES